jgi:hypothetical protein
VGLFHSGLACATAVFELNFHRNRHASAREVSDSRADSIALGRQIPLLWT